MKNVAQNKDQNKEGTRRVPALRFPEFSGGSAGISKGGASRARDAAAVGLEWEETKIEDVARINPGGETIPEKFVYIDLESVEKGVLKAEKTIDREHAPSRAQRKLKKRDVIFQMVRPYQQNNYLFDKEGDYVASTGYAQLRVYGDALFLYHYLHTTPFANKVLARCTGSSYPAIKSDDLKKIRINAPGANEQKKIAGCLGAVDEWVGILREEKSALETYKRGVMQRLFSPCHSRQASAGQATGGNFGSPCLRFHDDNGKDFPAWEEKKLGDFIEESSEKTETSNQFEVLSCTKEGIFRQSEFFKKQIASKENRGYKILQINQLVFSPQNLLLGNLSVNTEYEVGIVSPSYKIFNFNKKIIEILFAKYLLKLPKMMYEYSQISEQGASIVRRNLDPESFRSIRVLLPSLSEQKKIADFLTALDDLIAAKTNEISRAEEWKKGLMQKMFV